MARKKIKKSNTSKKIFKELSLGSKIKEYPSSYSPQLLEAFPNKNPSQDAWTSFICTEFTCLCPKTGQPDFARIYINYIADKLMVESRSLKLYLFSFRNNGDFHEDCIQKICNDLKQLLQPKYLEVVGEFSPRGGISIFPYTNRSNKNKKYQAIREKRLLEFSPGKYSMPLSKIY